jgi:phosphoserine phosphatase
MSFVLVLVAGDNHKALSLAHVAHVETFLENAGVVCDEPHWLNPHKAAEITLSADITDDVLLRLKDDMGRDCIDVFCVPKHNRRKKLLLADMDATIVEGETLDDLAAAVGLKEEISAITAQAMRGELDFQSALIARVKKLAGLSADALSNTLSAMVINDGAIDVVRAMRRHGAECYLVSGGFTYFTAAIAEICGFNGHHGNVLEIAEEKLTGEVIFPILDKDSKLAFLNQYRENLGLSEDDTMAVGDGANDIPMLLGAGLGVGFRPKPKVKDVVRNCIIHTDLTSLLYVQGYSIEDLS